MAFPSGMPQASDAASEPPLRVHVFRGGRGEVCVAAEGGRVLLAFGSLAGLSTYFGGYVTFGRLFSSNEYLGVWGHRNAGRFRRLLSEHFGPIEIVHAPPPSRHSGSSKTGARPPNDERRRLEQRLPRAI